jgi:hypothetical protein
VYEIAQQAVTGQLRSLSELVPSTQSELVDVVTRATALNASGRFASASDFKEALGRFAAARTEYAEPRTFGAVAPRTEYAEPATVGAVARSTEYGEPSASGALARSTQYGEPPALGALARSTEHPEPATFGVAPSGSGRNSVPNPALAAAPPLDLKANHRRVLASLAAGAIALLGLVALAVHERKTREQGTPPPPIALLAPETEIAPLDTESPDPGAAGGAPKLPTKSAVAHSASPQSSPAPLTAQPVEPTPRPVEPAARPVEPPSVVRVDGRRFRSCNTDAQASEVVVDVHVAPDGSVSGANTVSSSASAPVTECVLARARALQFQPHDGADEVARVPVELAASSNDEPREHRRHRLDWLHQRFWRDSE